MTHSTISLGVGLGGGKSATSSGRLPSGGGAFSNTLSASLDGTDDYFTLGSTVSFSGEFTVSTWVNLSSLSGFRLWFGALPGPHMYLFYYNNTVYYNTAHGQTRLTVTNVGWNTGEWHHVMVTRNSSNLITVFIDGSSAKTGTNSDTVTFNSFSVASYVFSGLIDEYASWDSDQSSNIGDIRDASSGTPKDLAQMGTTPLHWWRFGDGTGDTDSGGGAPASGDTIGTIVDQAGSNNAANPNGALYSSTVPS